MTDHNPADAFLPLPSQEEIGRASPYRVCEHCDGNGYLRHRTRSASPGNDFHTCPRCSGAGYFPARMETTP